MDKRVLIGKIDVVERGRKKFDAVALGELMESIRENGLIHPIHLRALADGRYRLVAGERRLRACALLGWKDMPFTLASEVGDPNSPGIKRKDKLKELTENISRDDLEWPERCELLRQIDELKREEKGSVLQGSGEGDGWKGDDLAEMTGASRSQVYRQVKFAKDLKARPDIAEKVTHLPMNVAMRQFEQIEEGERVKRLAESGQITLVGDLKLGAAEDLIREVPDESVDLLLTDPPFGIGSLMDGGGGEGATQSYKKVLGEEDDGNPDYVKALMRVLAPEFKRVLKPKAHLYIFFCNEMYGALMEILSRHFIMEPVPIIWDKGRTTRPFTGYSYASSYEPVLFGHKDPRERRLIEACRDIVTVKVVPSAKKVHPFEKPFELLEYFIKQSTNVGDTVLDPFAGSGSTLVTAKKLGRGAIGFEKSEKNFQAAQSRLMELTG